MSISESLNSILHSMPNLISDWVLVCTFIFAFIIDVFFKSKKVLSVISFTGLLVSLIILINQTIYHKIDVELFSGFYIITKNVLRFKLLLGIASIIALLPFVLGIVKAKTKEFYYLFPLLLWSANLLCMSQHFLSIFIGIEFLSILSYLYIAFEIKTKETAEASTKYILYGAFASAIMLYGISWLYTLTGTLTLNHIFLSALSKAPIMLVAMSLVLFISGFLFKISAAPFHYYSPDVYEGSSPSTLSFISTIPKVAGFAIFFSFLSHFHYNFQDTVLIWPNFSWEKAISILAIATMFVGNLSALAQQNIKRIMAYSSISHTGFMLIGMVVFSDMGLNALLFYAFVFIISNFSVFFLIQYWEDVYGVKTLKDLVGLGKTSGLSSAMMVVIIASLIGLPPFAGFVAKFLVFGSVFELYQGSLSPWLLFVLIAGVVNTVIALFYYLNIARHLFLIKGESKISIIENDYKAKMLLAIVVLLTTLLIAFGIFPDVFYSTIML